MKVLTRLVFASLMAAALLTTGPAGLASAAPALHAKSPAAGARTHGLAVAIMMTRGRHAVSETMPVSSRFQATLARSAHINRAATVAAAAVPQIQVRVGKNNCGGFNGDYSIYIDGYDQDPGGDILPLWALQVWGTEWDNCDYYTPNTTVYIYVKYSVGIATFDNYIDPPAPGNSVGIAGVYPTGLLVAGNVYVTACLKWNNGWGCGPSKGPFN